MTATGDVPYDTLAGAYDWLVPDELLTPGGSAAAFAPWTATLPPGARVLDCAAGTGRLAVGLSLEGFDVVATDASPAMVERTRALAADHGAAVTADVRRWEDLGGTPWAGRFDAVFCVGNSLTHAPGQEARRAALRGMATVLGDGGLLVVTSRNWEQVRAAGSALHVADRLVERAGRRGLVIYSWDLADSWDDVHHLDVAVALINEDGVVETLRERLEFWPFRQETLDADLRAGGFEPVSSTYVSDVERYLVTALRAGP